MVTVLLSVAAQKAVSSKGNIMTPKRKIDAAKQRATMGTPSKDAVAPRVGGNIASKVAAAKLAAASALPKAKPAARPAAVMPSRGGVENNFRGIPGLVNATAPTPRFGGGLSFDIGMPGKPGGNKVAPSKPAMGSMADQLLGGPKAGTPSKPAMGNNIGTAGFKGAPATFQSNQLRGGPAQGLGAAMSGPKTGLGTAMGMNKVAGAGAAMGKSFGMKSGGVTRADGCITKGHTKGRLI